MKIESIRDCPIRYNIMKHNDQSSFLLIWLNKWALSHQLPSLSSLSRLPSSPIPGIILPIIDAHYFTALLRNPFNHQQWLIKIQQYLLEHHDFKMKKGYRSVLMEREDIGDLVRLIFLVLMRQDTKGQLVAGVLQLGADVQVGLMEELKQVQDQLQNSTQIKEIYMKIQQLEDQNISLRDKLAQMQYRNLKTSKLKQQISIQNESLAQQHRQMLKEKNSVMEKLGLREMKDYVGVYRELEGERNELVQQQRIVESVSQEVEESNYSMEEKIEEDRTIVEHLSQEIVKYKQALQSIKGGEEGRPSFSKSKENKQNCLSLPLFPNVKMIRSIEHDTTLNSFAHSITSDQPQEDILTQSIRQYNQDMQHRLEELNTSVSKLNKQISILRQQNNKAAKSVLRKERTLQRVERELCEFRLNYDFTISG